ncbi:hypothetical protein [Wenyingzhuangia sp. IMCC45574]
MNVKKLVLGLALVVSTSVFSQKWIDNQVNNELAKTNKMLTETDKALVLTEEQTVKIKAIYKEFALIRAEKGKTIKDKKELWAALKPQLKEKNTKVNELLSEEQKQALRQAWRKNNKK